MGRSPSQHDVNLSLPYMRAVGCVFTAFNCMLYIYALLISHTSSLMLTSSPAFSS